MNKSYKIKFAHSSRDDMRNMKKYILDTFKYQELGESFTKKMKDATKSLKIWPAGNAMIGLEYRGYDIYLKFYCTYLFFYIVDESTKTVTIIRVMKDGMNWKSILRRWLNDEK